MEKLFVCSGFSDFLSRRDKNNIAHLYVCMHIIDSGLQSEAMT